MVPAAGVRGLNPSRVDTMTEATKGRNVMGERKERRGFASMSPEKQREIASKGGRAAHQKGTAHEWTSEEARSAGRKGGQISRGGRGRLVGSSVMESETASEDAPVEVGVADGQ
jgi:general stress protein YciG